MINKNKEFDSKRQSVKQLYDRGKSLGDDSGFLFALNTGCDKSNDKFWNDYFMAPIILLKFAQNL